MLLQFVAWDYLSMHGWIQRHFERQKASFNAFLNLYIAVGSKKWDGASGVEPS